MDWVVCEVRVVRVVVVVGVNGILIFLTHLLTMPHAAGKKAVATL